MKGLVQRVQYAKCVVNGKTTGEIEKGFLLFLGVTHSDTKQSVEKLIEKVHKLRIFEDENGKTNLSLDDVNGKVLVISQFTLYADTSRGARPGFENAAKATHANELYEYFLEKWKSLYGEVQHGIFGADMKISLLNDGPFTVMLEVE